MNKPKLIKTILLVALAVMMLLPVFMPKANADEIDDIIYDDFRGIDPPVAMKGDMALATAPIATDDPSGTIKVRLYLKYKTSFNMDNLSFFEISPIVDGTEDYPFDITWSSYVQSKGNQLTDDPYDPKYGTPTSIPEKYFEFEFQRKKDCLNGYYEIKFKVRFLHSGQLISYTPIVEDEVSVYVQIVNGKDPETPTPSFTPTPVPPDATPKPQSKVILNKFEISPEDVVGGDSFDLKLVLENTHAKNTARNMRCTLTDPDGFVLPESGSSTFYVEKIEPGKTQEITIRLMALPEAGIKPVRMSLAMEYDDAFASGIKIEESFTLPIHQVIRLEYDDPFLPKQVYVDESFDLSFSFRNTGKAAMYNTLVTLESETMRADATLYVGTMEGGTQRSYEPYITIASDKLQFAVPAGGSFDGANSFDEIPADGDIPEGEFVPEEGDVPDEDGNYGSLSFMGDYVSAKEPAAYVGDSARTVSNAVAVALPAPAPTASSGDSMMGTSDFAPGSMVCSGNIVITYEDNMGQKFRKEIPIQTSVMSFEQAYGPDPYMPYYDYATGYMIDPRTGEYLDPVTGLPIERGLAPWIIIVLIAAGVVVVVAAIIVIRVVIKRKKKKLEMAAENELADLRNGDSQ